MSTRPLRAEELRAALSTTLEDAIRAGATAADAVLLQSASFSAGVRLGEIEKLTDARQKRLGLRVFVGERSAVASTADLARGALARFAADTVALARVTQPDPASGLPELGQLAREAPDLELYDDAAETAVPAEGLERARATEAAALGADPRVTNSEGAEFAQDASTIAYASTLGFDAGYRSSSFYLGVQPIVSMNGTMERDYWYSRSRHLRGIDPPAQIGAHAAARALRRLGARRMPTQEAPVVFEAEVAASLLRHLAGAVTGASLYRGTSFLLGKLGETIASPHVTVVDDGRLVGGLGSRPFDAEGLPTRRTVVVDAGVLTSYLLDTYSARRLELASTGNAARAIGDAPGAAPTNFFLRAGTHTPEEIIASVDRGVLVTELIGFGVNPVTGDYSRGAAGIWIENGELTHPVEEITIAGNLLAMFRDIEMVGNDLTFRGSTAAPTVKIGKMMIAGT